MVQMNNGSVWLIVSALPTWAGPRLDKRCGAPLTRQVQHVWLVCDGHAVGAVGTTPRETDAHCNDHKTQHRHWKKENKHHHIPAIEAIQEGPQADGATTRTYGAPMGRPSGPAIRSGLARAVAAARRAGPTFEQSRR